jgi:hypothetical protein
MPRSPQDVANVNAPRSSGVGPAADDDTELTAMAGNQPTDTVATASRMRSASES